MNGVNLAVHPPVSSSLYKNNTNELESRGDLQRQIVFFFNSFYCISN